MRPRPPPDFRWRRRMGVFTCLIMGSVMGWWIRDQSRAQPPAAYSWVKTAEASEDSYFSPRWRRHNGAAEVKVGEGEYLYWLSPQGIEVVPGPDVRLAPEGDPRGRHPLWLSRQELRELKWEAPPESPKIRIHSPVGVTRYRNPTLDWAAKEGVKYDVAVVDVDDSYAPPRVLREVRPPIALLALETTEPRPLLTGHNYHVLVQESGQPDTLSLARVLVADDAQAEPPAVTPGLALFEAAEAMRRKPYRTGDAWLRLQGLPKEWASTELARRLRLLTASELGWYEEAKSARDELLK